MIWLLVLTGAFGLLVIVVGLASMRTDRRALEQRLERVTVGIGAGAASAESKPSFRVSPFGDKLNQALENRSFAQRIRTDLARADLKLNVGEYFSLILFSAIGFGLVGGLIGRSIGAGIVAGIFGLFVPRMYVGYQKGQRLKRFDDQLPDMINQAVNGLRAGYSPMQALESVGRELPPPISTEFRRVVQEMQLGFPMEAALDHLLERIPSLDLDLMVTAMNVQREVGGNLAEILDTISATIRERIKIKGQIRAITSQQRGSAWLLSLMPFALFGVLMLGSPSYILQFVRPPQNMIFGIPMLFVAFVLIGMGIVVMNKIVDIDI